MEMAIDKDGYLNVRYTIHLPDGLPEGSYNCAAGFTTLPAVTGPKAAMGLSMAVRVVDAFYIVVGKPAISRKTGTRSPSSPPRLRKTATRDSAPLLC